MRVLSLLSFHLIKTIYYIRRL